MPGAGSVMSETSTTHVYPSYYSFSLRFLCLPRDRLSKVVPVKVEESLPAGKTSAMDLHWLLFAQAFAVQIYYYSA